MTLNWIIASLCLLPSWCPNLFYLKTHNFIKGPMDFILLPHGKVIITYNWRRFSFLFHEFLTPLTSWRTVSLIRNTRWGLRPEKSSIPQNCRTHRWLRSKKWNMSILKKKMDEDHLWCRRGYETNGHGNGWAKPEVTSFHAAVSSFPIQLRLSLNKERCYVWTSLFIYW